jgi:predicted ATPase
MDNAPQPFPSIRSLKLHGYRPFGEFLARFSALEVIVGANSSGKSSLFEFLKFLRNAVEQDIPPEIVAGSIGQQIFHRPGPDRFAWSVEIDLLRPGRLHYEGEVLGPIGQTRVSFERVHLSHAPGTHDDQTFIFMDVHGRKGYALEPAERSSPRQELDLRRPNQLALSVMTNPALATLYNLREFIAGWRFYSSFNIDNDKIRKSTPIEQQPVLHEDGANLSAVLFNLMSEHPLVFDELKYHLRAAVPGFRNLAVKARGGPGEVIAFWQEEGVDGELSLADLSDGALRFLAWATLALAPAPPSLICIDEPDQGVHPRTLPILAGLFRKASQRTQLLLATHASYFLTQFDLQHLAIMKKSGGESQYLKPGDSAALRANLADFGVDELEAMHRNDELEALT